MGEFGAFVHLFDSVDSAAKALVEWQVESCKLGFDGWLTWTWDDSTVGEVLPATADDDQIAEWLSPKVRPVPCAYGGGFVRNLSLSAAATASRSFPEEPPSNAIDGLSVTQWGSGENPPQWIEIDLGNIHTVTEIKLQIAQWPEGDTIHRVLVRGENEKNREVFKFRQKTKGDDWLSYKPVTPLEGVRFIRIETTLSPSWVAWKEIQVLGE